MSGLVAGMLAITLWPEWAHGVAHLGKRIENRDWKPWASLIGTRIAIHAGAHIGGRKGKPATLEGLQSVLFTAVSFARLDVKYGSVNPRISLDGEERPVVCGAIICTAVIARAEYNKRHDRMIRADDCPAWANHRSRYWWHLTDVEVLPEPVPCKGAQGFWAWPRDTDTDTTGDPS